MVFWKRRRRPDPPLPPENLLDGVGPGDYWRIGQETVDLVDELVTIRPDDRILDVGCGLGRVAWPLASRLGRKGRYTGLDVSKWYVGWCRENLALDPRRFTFHRADIRTSAYNTEGSMAPEEFVFPWPEESFDLTLAISIFTHLLPQALRHYLQEIGRTLRPGGRIVSTWFLLDAQGKSAVASGFTYPTFTAPIEHGLLHDPLVPEAGVAYEPDWVFASFAAAGLAVTGVHHGSWKTFAEGRSYQDVVVAVLDSSSPPLL
jgi:SAM-dependent methyltransferase